MKALTEGAVTTVGYELLDEEEAIGLHKHASYNIGHPGKPDKVACASIKRQAGDKVELLLSECIKLKMVIVSTLKTLKLSTTVVSKEAA